VDLIHVSSRRDRCRECRPSGRVFVGSRPSHAAAHVEIELGRAEVYVSAASIWEVSVKASIGRLKADPAEVLAAVAPAGFSMLAITEEHAAKVIELPPLHKDPFDRVLIAQTLTEPMILLTNDEALRGYGPFVRLV
jgi:PIN domain nuclease of toxin-antitoxin system